MKEKVSGAAGYVYRGQTDFGREVGRDEINWWVFRKETNIDNLREQSQRALEACQSLKQASAGLRRNEPESYGELLHTLRRFAEEHVAEINTLREYVLWLSTRDAMAPKILFTYRVWGSTRMGDRWVEVGEGTPEGPSLEVIQHLTEIVLGLASPRLRAIDRAYWEVGEEMWSNPEFDEEAGSAQIEVPMALVVRRAARIVYGDCDTYFTFIRDSLRNILLDIEKSVEQRDLMNSDAFWRAFVEKAVRTLKAETELT